MNLLSRPRSPRNQPNRRERSSPTTQRLARPRRTPAEWWHAHRRLVAAVSAFCSVGLGLSIVSAQAPPRASVVAPAHAIAAGQAVTADDLTTVELLGSAPDGALTRTSDVVGQTLAVDWPAGVPLHESALAGSEMLREVSSGHVAVGVALSNTVSAGFVRRGDYVDVVLTRADEVGDVHTDVVAARAKVLWAGSPDTAADWLPIGKQDADGAIVVLEVTEDQAPVVSAAHQRGSVTLVIRRPGESER